MLPDCFCIVGEGIVVFREKLALVQRLSAFIVGVAGNLVKTMGNFSSGAYAKVRFVDQLETCSDRADQ